MQLELITPEKVVLSQEVDELILDTPKGQIAVLPHHTNLLTKISPGEMVVKSHGKESYLAVTGGFLEISNGKITLLADFAVKSEEIIVEQAMKAQDRAKEALKKKESLSQQDYALASSELQKAIAQLHVANRRKRQRIPQG